MNIKGFLYDLDDTLISRDNAFLGFTKKFYESFIDAYDFSYDEFLKIIRITKNQLNFLIRLKY